MTESPHARVEVKGKTLFRGLRYQCYIFVMEQNLVHTRGRKINTLLPWVKIIVEPEAEKDGRSTVPK